MKIAFFTDTFTPTVNGVVSSLLNIAHGLSQQGHQLMIFAPRHPRVASSEISILPNVEIVYHPSINARLYPDTRLGLPAWEPFQRFKQFQPDVIHSMTHFSIGLEAIIFARRTQVPLVFTNNTDFDEAGMIDSVKFLNNALTKKLYSGVGPIIKRYLDLHDHITVASPDRKKELIGKGLTKPISVIPMPIPVDKLVSAEQQGVKLKKSLGIRQALLYAGRLSKEKQLHKLIHLFSHLAPDFPELKLVLIGDGPDRDALFGLANKARVNQQIIWFGEMTYAEIVEKGLYYCGDIFVTYSELETQGLSTVEAMACGLAVAGMPIKGSKDVIEDVGLFLDAQPQKATTQISQLLQDNKLLNSYKLRSQRAAQAYSISQCTNSLVAIYQQLIT